MLERGGQGLSIDGLSLAKIKEEYGTPCYVYSLDQIKEPIRELKRDFLGKYPRTLVSYAAKAFFCKAMGQLIDQEGLNLDVVSGGELYAALESGLDPERIEFNGNNKSYQELDLAVSRGVGKIIVDGAEEVLILQDLGKKYQKKVRVLFRITPEVRAQTHSYMVTANVDTKFGFPLGQVKEVLREVMDLDQLIFQGYHFHLGSQIFDNQVYLNALDNIKALLEDTIEIAGQIREINLGGGFGIGYAQGNRRPYSYFLDPVMAKLEEIFQDLGQERPWVTIEPGRSIVGEAGYTLYTVGSIKDIPQVRKYVAVDGGMADNIRPALYQAEYDLVADKSDVEEELVTVCGKCCESGDIVRWNIDLPRLARGDLVLVKSTGAYGYSMSSNYNMLPRPPVVFVEDGRARLAVRGQTYEDLIQGDLDL